jgi:hypothetical protein
MTTPQPLATNNASPFSDQAGEFGKCWLVARTNLNIHESPSTGSRSISYLNVGQALPTSCLAQRGEPYTDCGGGDFWIPVPYQSGTGYVALRCVEWYTPRAASQPEPDPRHPRHHGQH